MTPIERPPRPGAGGELDPQLAARVERFLAAVREGKAAAARRLLRRYPEIARADLFAAAVAGAEDVVAAALAAAPERARARHEPDGWTPLLYLAASRFHARDPARAAATLRAAELLLDHGADPNSFMLCDPSDEASRIPALYFACVGGNAGLVRLLLARGADPNDGESVYHAAELDRRACLELLLAAGADLGSRHAHWNNTPLYFLSGYREGHPGTARATRGMRWLLAHGADPNVTSYDHAETPLHAIASHGRGPAVAELLLAHGAAVDARRADGRTPYALAVRAGNAAVADLLRARGAETVGLAPADELFGACLRADAAAARAVLARHPGLLGELTPEDRGALGHAAGEGREASVRLLVELGFDLAWEGPWGGTPLHWAAWHGQLEMVRLLLGLGAPLAVRDSQYGSSPLGWAAHGSRFCRRADGDYRAVVAALLDAGAGREVSINRWGEPPESFASRGVAALLRERGFVP